MPVTRSGQVYAYNLNPGIGQDVAFAGADNFANFGGGGMAYAAPVTSMTTSSAMAPAKTSTLWYMFAVALFLVAYKFAVEHEKSKMDFSFMNIGVFNFVAGGTMALLFIVFIKTVLNKYQVPGLTDLVNIA